MTWRAKQKLSPIYLFALNTAKYIVLGFFAVAFFVFFDSASAIPNAINYQARLRDNGGTPIIVSTTIQFSIYNDLTGGAPSGTPGQNGPLLWTETYDQASGACVKVSPDANGYFTLTLGDCVAFPDYLDFSTGTYYLGVKIGGDSEASPRVKLNSAPYALNSHRVDGLHATTTATAGQLLALDNNFNFNIASGTYGGASINLTSTTAASSISGNLSVVGNATFATATIGNLIISSPVNLTNFTFGSATGTNLSLNTLTVTGTSNFGIIASGTWQGSIIGAAYGGTGQNTSGWSGFTKLINGTWTTSTIGLTADVSGILPIANGGTNASSFTSSQFLWFNGTSIVASGYDNASFMTAGTDDWVNVSGDTMSGALTINNNLTVTGTSIFEYVGIGTTTPLAKLDVNGNMILSGPGRYINFNSATGTDGYGFRDNSGTMQYKNQSGNWKNITTKIDHIINVAKEGGDYDNLKDAIDAANAAPYDVVINIYPGAYDVSSTLVVTSTRIKGIRGISAEGVVIQPTADMVSSPQPIFEIAFPTDNNFAMSFLTIDGSAAPGFETTAGCTAIKVSTPGETWMNFNNMFIRHVETGVDDQVANWLYIKNTDFYNIGNVGVILDNGVEVQVESSYMENVGNWFTKVKSTASTSYLYLVASEFYSTDGLGTGVDIESDGSYAELRQTSMSGLEYNIQSRDTSVVLVSASSLWAATVYNIYQKDTSKITVVNSTGDFSAGDLSIENAGLVYFNVASQGDQATLIGSGANVNQDLFLINNGEVARPSLSYRNNYFSDSGLMFINRNSGEVTSLGVFSTTSIAKLQDVTGNRSADVILEMHSNTGVFGEPGSLRGWNMTRKGSEASLDFSFYNTDVGDGKPTTTRDSMVVFDGFNNQVIVNGGAVFNTSSGAYDFQVKGAADENLLFVQGSTDRIGIGTSTPNAKLEIASANANALRIDAYGASSGETGELQFMDLAGNFYVGFKAPDSMSSNMIYTWPTSSVSGHLANNNGALYWETNNYQLLSEKNQPGGYAGLDANSLIADSQVKDLAYIRQSEIDRQSSGLGGNSPSSTLIKKSVTLGQIDVGAGFGYVNDNSGASGTYKRIDFTGSSSIPVIGFGVNHVAIDASGNVNVSLTKQDSLTHIYLGYCYVVAGNYVNACYNLPIWAGNFPSRVDTFVTQAVRTLVADGNIVTEQGSPNELKLNVSGGTIYSRLSQIILATSTTFLKTYRVNGVSYVDTSSPNYVNTDKWDNTTVGLVTMTDGYWKKDLVIRGTDGSVFVAYSQTEYATEDEAKAGPLPEAPADVKRDMANLAVIVSQKGDTSISNRIQIITPNLNRVFGYGTAGVGGAGVDHGNLFGLLDDDHSQYALLAGRNSGQTLIGGILATSTFVLRTTAGNAVSGADMIFQTGNNGATEAMRIFYNGNISMSHDLSINGAFSAGGTSTLSGPILAGNYFKFSSSTDNYLYFNNSNSNYLKWDSANGKFALSNGLDAGGTVTSTGLYVNGTARATDLVVGNSITLGGVSRNTWPSGGGGGGSGFWATTTNNVGYVTLDNPYAIVIGSSATTSNSIFEVQGNSKFIGDLTITGNATSANFYATNINWVTASGTGLTFGSATGTNFTLSDLANLNGALKVGDTSSTVSGAIKFSGNDFLGYDGSYWRSLTNVASARGEATGFPNVSASTISFNDPARTFIIAPVSGSFDFYYQGAKFTKSAGQTTVIDDTEGLWYIYFDNNGNLQHSQTEPDEKTVVSVAMVYWNAAEDKAIMVGEYRSGLTMDADTHAWIRMTVGPRYSSGLTLSGNTTGDGTLDADAEVALSGGVIYDEDLAYNIVNTTTPVNRFEQDLGTGSGSSVTAPAKIPLYYRLGASGAARKKTATSFPVYENSGSRLAYNPYSGGWVTSTVPDGEYVAVWIFATHNISEPIIAVLGQRIDAIDTDARMNNTYAGLTLDSLPFQNMKVLYRVIYKTDDTYVNAVKARIIDIQDYRDVSSLPSGNYVASAHGALTGLNQDDHSQYFLLNGRNSGQTAFGSVIAGGNLTLDSTNHADKGSVFIQPVGGIVVIGTSTASSPSVSLLSLQGNSTVSSLFNVASSSGASYLRINNDGNVGIGTTTPGYALTVAATASMRDVLPETDLAYSLGSAVQRWNNVYANTGTFANLSVSNPAHFTGLTFDNATGTSMYLSGGEIVDRLTVTNTSTLAGPALLGSYMQFTTAGNNFIYFNNTTTNYFEWSSSTGQFAMSNGVSVNGTVSSTGLVVNSNSTTTGNVYIGGGLNVVGATTLATSTVTNLVVTQSASTSQLIVANTSTLTGPALLGSYMQFTTAGDNAIYFNNTSSDYLIWNNAFSRFDLSNALNVAGTITSTGLVVNGTANVTDLLVGNAITLGGVSRSIWPTGGGGGGDSVWSTTSAKVVYPDLSNPYAVVIGSSVTSSNVIFEVSGDSKLGGNITITGTTTMQGAVLADGSIKFTTVGDNNLYFADSNSNYLKWNNSASRFDLSHSLSVNGTVSSTALIINGNATTTGNYYNGGSATTSGNYYIGGSINVSGTYKMGGLDYGQYFIDSAGASGTVWMSDNVGRGYWVPTSSFGLGLAAGQTGYLQFNSGGVLAATSVLFWDNTNYRLGINTTTPQGVLSVVGRNTSSIFQAYTSLSIPKFTINNTGDVGIGTTTPLAALHINQGDILFTTGTVAWMMGPDAFPNRSVNTDAVGLSMTNSSTWQSGLFSEVNGQLLSYGINVTQLGARNTSSIGAIFRLDTRAATPYWSIKRQSIGTNTEVSDMQIAQTGEIGFGGFANDTNSFLGQVHVLSAASSTVGFTIQGAAGQTADLQQWRDNSANILGSAKILSTNFGMSMDTGAFMDRNSYIGEEFMRDRTTVTVSGNQNWGDFTQFSTNETDCSWSVANSVVNGIFVQATAGGGGNSCLTYHSTAGAAGAHTIFNAANLPVLLMKAYPSADSANDILWMGLSSLAAAQATDPINGIYFTNNTTNGNWRGVTRRAGASTNVECTGQTVNNTVFALMKIEVISSNGAGAGSVKFYIDNDTTNGIQWTYCGESVSNIPTVGLTSMMMNYSTTNGETLNVDFYRVWQDDSAADTGSVLVLDQPIEEVPQLSTEDRVAIVETNVADIRTVLGQYNIKIDENISSTAALAGSVNALNISLSDTQAMLAALDNRVAMLENAASSTASALTDINSALNDADARLAALASSTVGLELGAGIYGDLSANALIVNSLAVFNGPISVKKHAAFGEDTVGQAKILAGHSSTTVTFVEPYETLPIVSVTPIDFDGKWKLTDVVTSGFKVAIGEIQAADILFNWQVFGAQPESKVFVSDGTTTTIGFVVVYSPPVAPEEPVVEPTLPASEPIINPTDNPTEPPVIEPPAADQSSTSSPDGVDEPAPPVEPIAGDATPPAEGDGAPI